MSEAAKKSPTSIRTRPRAAPSAAPSVVLGKSLKKPNQRASSADTLARRDWIAGLENGLTVMEAFGEAHPRLNASEAARQTGLSRTAARRQLLTLAHLGYCETDGTEYWLTPRVLRLGRAYFESSRLPRTVQPFLQRVTASTRESAHLSVLDGSEVIYIARNGTTRVMNSGWVLGARAPAHTVSSGLMLLALLSAPEFDAWLKRTPLAAFTNFTITEPKRLRATVAEVCARGYAVSSQAMSLHERGVAVALRNRFGVALGAINVTMPLLIDGKLESAEHAVARVLPVLQETAQVLRELI